MCIIQKVGKKVSYKKLVQKVPINIYAFTTVILGYGKCHILVITTTNSSNSTQLLTTTASITNFCQLYKTTMIMMMMITATTITVVFPMITGLNFLPHSNLDYIYQ